MRRIVNDSANLQNGNKVPQPSHLDPYFATGGTNGGFDRRAAAHFSVVRRTVTLEVHYLSIEAIDRRGVTPERYVFHCQKEAVIALGTPLTESLATAPNSSIDSRWTDARRKSDLAWLFNFRNAIREEIGLMCESDRWSPALNYRVYDCGSKREIGFGVSFSGDGAVRWVEPPTSEPPSSVTEFNGRSVEEHFVRWVGAPFGVKRTSNGLGACIP